MIKISYLEKDTKFMFQGNQMIVLKWLMSSTNMQIVWQNPSLILRCNLVLFWQRNSNNFHKMDIQNIKKYSVLYGFQLF